MRVRTFTILYLRGSVLERAEELASTDVLQAIASAAGQAPDITVEIWSEQRRVALVRTRNEK